MGEGIGAFDAFHEQDFQFLTALHVPGGVDQALDGEFLNEACGLEGVEEFGAEPIAAIWSFSPPSRTRQAFSARYKRRRSYPGFNLFDADDDALFQAIIRGEFNISGLQNKSLRRFLPHLNSGQVSRLLKRLRLHCIA